MKTAPVRLMKHFLFLLLAAMLVGCGEKVVNTNRDVTIARFDSLADARFQARDTHIRRQMEALMGQDRDSMTADYRTRSYYRKGGSFVWIDRKGIDHRAYTLLAYLRKVTDIGFSLRKFGVKQIEADLQAIRTLQTGGDDVEEVLARLEYRLTKAYLRYAAGQRFGYVNPTFVLNTLDTIVPARQDSVRRPVRYRGLFDVTMEHSSKRFFLSALRKAQHDSLALFLREIQPKGALFETLCKRLNTEGLSKSERVKILCNMERCRWRTADAPQQYDKYVLVNIPSLHLMAVDHADTLTMRIGCGSYKTKTPLLTSRVKRMDVNPKWFVPRSIVERDIAHHAGNRYYFESRRFYVMKRSTGKEVDPSVVSYSMLLDPAYAVVQRGGKGNSLGRIIFRFDNNFSVFLHDTSSRGVFQQADRSVSHGCVRVEKPYELAEFLIGDGREELKDKVRYCMTADSIADRSMVVGSVKVEPNVPIFITYYTLYPARQGRLEEYADIYGYDSVLYRGLLNYI